MPVLVFIFIDFQKVVAEGLVVDGTNGSALLTGAITVIFQITIFIRKESPSIISLTILFTFFIDS